MNLSAKFLIKILGKNEFVFKRVKGSHHIYFNITTNKTVVVPMHGNKDLPKGTFFAILKQAGINPENSDEFSARRANERQNAVNLYVMSNS